MKRIFFFLLLFTSLLQLSKAQVNYSEHIASIFYQKCTNCHRTGAIGHFPLETYQDAVPHASGILSAVSAGTMPPWPPDTNYKRLAHERILTVQEKQSIIDWITSGTPQGNPALAPPLPNYPSGSQLGATDLSLQIPTYTSTAISNDVYQCFVIPSGLTQSRNIKAMEVLPGNLSIVHHVLVFVDTNNTVQPGACMGLNSPGLILIGGYTPGSNPDVFPNGNGINMGVTIPAGKNIVVQIHYPKGSAGQTDNTKINFLFYPPATPVRKINIVPLIQNWTLNIPSETVKTYTAQYPAGNLVIPGNYTCIGIMPHMHMIGKSMEVYVVSALNDTIKLIRINNWDFHWQGFYHFKKPVKIPFGSKIRAKAVYDNTSANPNNPSNPPVLVQAGEQTTDEMFMAYFQYLDYVSGDENLNLENMTNIPASINNLQKPEIIPSLTISPNPTKGNIVVYYGLPKTGTVQLRIVDVLGKEIYSSDQGLQAEGLYERQADLSQMPEGLYLVQLITREYTMQSKLFLKK